GEDAEGSRTHRVRLVGRRRCTPRLLPDRNPFRSAGLGLSRRGRTRSLAAAGLVRMSGEYAELHCLSNFSFQRGASSAKELFERARAHGYRKLAITDECTLAGIVRAWQAAKESELTLIVGSEMQVHNGPKVVLLVENLEGYQTLCKLITQARRRAKKGEYLLLREDFSSPMSGLCALWVPNEMPDHSRECEEGSWLRDCFPQRLWLAVELHRGPNDAQRLAYLQGNARELAIPTVAAGDVHMHARGRRALQDTLTAVRHHVTVAGAGIGCSPMANGIFGHTNSCANSIHRSYWKRHCALPSAAPSILVSCAMSTPTSWCRPGRRRPVGCEN